MTYPYDSGGSTDQPQQPTPGYGEVYTSSGNFPQPGAAYPGSTAPGYPPASYAQAGYAQPGYPQPGYSQPGYPQPGWGVPRPTNGMAIASLVLGVLWITWLGSILALIFGYIARGQIRERGESGDGMAIAGIILGWIGIGTLVLFLIPILIAVFSATTVSFY